MTNRNLLLNDKAKVYTRPQLEIFADDVKCTHGATIGRIDDEARFYLQARGIGHDAAAACSSRPLMKSSRTSPSSASPDWNRSCRIDFDGAMFR